MKLLIMVFVMLTATASFANDAENTGIALKKFESALKVKLGLSSSLESSELKVRVVQSLDAECGGAGPTLVGDLLIAREKRVDNGETIPTFKTEYEVVKSYVVSQEDALKYKRSELVNYIMGDDTCYE